MKYPSVKAIRLHLLSVGFTDEQAKLEAPKLRAAMEKRIGLRYYNDLRDLFGVETIYLPDGCADNCQEPEHTIWYANTGYTYKPTLLKVDGRYVFGDWGSYVERWS
jgi:hypothetical protein